MAQQTSVEWLIHELNTRQKPLDNSQIDKLFEEAKRMNEIEIISSYQQGCIDGYEPHYGNGKDYYRETYNK